MRPLAVFCAASAAWTLTGGALPPSPRLVLDRRRLLSLASAAGAAAPAWAVGLGLSGDPVIAAALAVLASALPPAAAASRRRREEQATADRWPDLLRTIQGHLAGGATIADATIAAGRQVGGRHGAAANRLAELLAAGRSFQEATTELRDDWDDPLADRVLTTLASAAATGGTRVASILASLGASVADELRLRRAHQAALTQQRLTAAVALVAPWILLVLTTSTNPQAAAALARPTGRLIVIGGLTATIVGFGLARRTARLGRPPRVFR